MDLTTTFRHFLFIDQFFVSCAFYTLMLSFAEILHFNFIFHHKYRSLVCLLEREKSFRADQSMKMIQSRDYRGSRYNTYVSFVRCIGDLLEANSKDWAHLEWCAPDEYSREPRSSAERRIGRTRKRRRVRGRRRLRSLCTLTTVGTGRAIDQTRIGRSRIVLLLQGARTWAMAVHER